MRRRSEKCFGTFLRCIDAISVSGGRYAMLPGQIIILYDILHPCTLSHAFAFVTHVLLP